jgi:hypothetical protein
LDGRRRKRGREREREKKTKEKEEMLYSAPLTKDAKTLFDESPIRSLRVARNSGRCRD